MKLQRFIRFSFSFNLILPTSYRSVSRVNIVEPPLDASHRDTPPSLNLGYQLRLFPSRHQPTFSFQITTSNLQLTSNKLNPTQPNYSTLNFTKPNNKHKQTNNYNASIPPPSPPRPSPKHHPHNNPPLIIIILLLTPIPPQTPRRPTSRIRTPPARSRRIVRLPGSSFNPDSARDGNSSPHNNRFLFLFSFGAEDGRQYDAESGPVSWRATGIRGRYESQDGRGGRAEE